MGTHPSTVPHSGMWRRRPRPAQTTSPHNSFSAPLFAPSLVCVRSIVIQKHYKKGVKDSVCTTWWEAVQKHDDPHDAHPVTATNKFICIHVNRFNMYWLAIVKEETPPVMVLEFLNRAVSIFYDYFGDLTEELIKDNFVTVYQVRSPNPLGVQSTDTRPRIVVLVWCGLNEARPDTYPLPPCVAHRCAPVAGGAHG